MKRLLGLLCTLTLCLLCACGKSAAPYTPDLANALLEGDVFSEPLEPLDAEIACFIYRLDSEQDGLTDLQVHRSAGATYEEVAVLTFTDEAAAAAALSTLEEYVSTRLADCRSYMPDQAPKLEHAILNQRSNSILLVVADDWTTARTLAE